MNKLFRNNFNQECQNLIYWKLQNISQQLILKDINKWKNLFSFMDKNN